MDKKYVDSRHVDRKRMGYMSRATFQDAQKEAAKAEEEPLPKRIRLEATTTTEKAIEDSRDNEEPVELKREKRKRYKAEDFTYKTSQREQVDSWFLQYPVLRKRNFYTVQNHHATSKHFDLRLHLFGGLFSFAIPRGLVLKSERDSSNIGLKRLAVETTIHPLNYALFEGVGSTGTTGVWDIGEYKVHLSKKKQQARQRLLDQGFDDQETTDDEDDDEEGDVKLEEDERQEDLLKNALQRSSFSSGRVLEVTNQEGELKPDKGEYRGFILELIGARYQGLRFTLARNSSDFKHVRHKDSGQNVRTARWYLTLSDPSGNTPLSRIENSSLSPLKSLLTSRTMQEIGKEGGAKPRGRAKDKGNKKKLNDEEDTTDAEKGEEEEDEDGRETQGLLDVEGNGLKWFQEMQSGRKEGH